jgi:cobalamin-dependent methionine synthase I
MLTLAEGASFSLNKVIFRLLCESEELMFFICTAGSAVSKWAASLAAAGDPLASFVVDALGSVMAEATADLMHRRIRGRMTLDDKEVTNRYSPGYCGWPVSDQPHLFSLFPEDICGVKLTETCLMNPIKSVSGVIGVGKQVVFTPHLCSTCVPEHCPHN